jgi:hypothetical protein
VKVAAERGVVETAKMAIALFERRVSFLLADKDEM